MSTVTEGVVDCLSKPFGRDRLRDAVARGMEWHRTARESRCWRERLDHDIEVLKAKKYAGAVSFETFAPDVQGTDPYQVAMRVRAAIEPLIK